MKINVRSQQTYAPQGKAETSFALLFWLNAKVHKTYRFNQFLTVCAYVLVSSLYISCDQTVYVTPKGTHFHLKKDCVKHHEIKSMSLDDAKEFYEPCGKCAKDYTHLRK